MTRTKSYVAKTLVAMRSDPASRAALARRRRVRRAAWAATEKMAVTARAFLVALVLTCLSVGTFNIVVAESASLVDDTYCSEAVLRHPTVHLDFNCLRDANQSSAAVKILGIAGSASACKALCLEYSYRGQPCRSYTFFGARHRRAAFRSHCYGRIDSLLPSSPDPEATSESLRLPDCATDSHCELNGRCTANGTCICHPGWRGRHCQTLALAPAKPNNGYRRANFSSWGGSVAKDVVRNRWVMFVAEIAMHCGLNSWFLLSQIIRASSVDPEGPYEREKVIVEYLVRENPAN